MNTPSIKIGKRIISSESACYIIAEIGVNHNGNIDLGHQLIDQAKRCGADAVKFQAFKTNNLVTPYAPKAAYQKNSTGSGTQEEMLQSLELPEQAYIEFKSHCDAINLDFICTAFDATSLNNILKLKPVCIKWPSGEINNSLLMRSLKNTSLPIILSTGMSDLGEIETAYNDLKNQGIKQIALLQCVSNYPALIEDQNLRAIVSLREKFKCPTGFSDHTLGPFSAIAARALGMAILEKHFTLDTKMPGPDHSASCEPEDFLTLTSALRKIETALGSGEKLINNNEMNVKNVARKSLVFSNDLSRGTKIRLVDLDAKRPGTGVAPTKYQKFIGRILQVDVRKDEILAESMFK